jgi:hypothetical protein
MRGPILVLVIVLIAALVLAKLRGRSSVGGVLDYRKKRTLLSPAERSFLGVLEQASDRQRAFNRISAKHLDFVLCAPDDLSVVGAVELDDMSHQQSGRRGRDAFLAAACQSASLPLVQVKAQRAYSIDELRGTLSKALGRA